MRCKNCHTAMMETDSACPSCHASAARALANAPGAINKGPGLGILLPIFGGAIGGAIYAGIKIAEANAASGSSHAYAGNAGSSQSTTYLKWVFGLPLMIGGGLFLVLACTHFSATWNVAQRVPTAATAADLCRSEYAASAPSWITYTFAEAQPTRLTVTRHRMGNAGDVQARCLLVRVEDKWLVATVAPGFKGKNLVGRLLPVDSPPSQALIERLRKLDTTPAGLLPYEFNAVDGSASDHQVRYVAAGLLAFFGLGGVALGLYLLCGRRRPAEAQTAAAISNWASNSLPKR